MTRSGTQMQREMQHWNNQACHTLCAHRLVALVHRGRCHGNRTADSGSAAATAAETTRILQATQPGGVQTTGSGHTDRASLRIQAWNHYSKPVESGTFGREQCRASRMRIILMQSPSRRRLKATRNGLSETARNIRGCRNTGPAGSTKRERPECGSLCLAERATLWARGSIRRASV